MWLELRTATLSQHRNCFPNMREREREDKKIVDNSMFCSLRVKNETQYDIPKTHPFA